MGRKRTGTASIPAPGDGAGESRGGAAPGSKGRETASGRSEEHAAASETTAKPGADLSASKWLMVPRPTRPTELSQPESDESDFSPKITIRTLPVGVEMGDLLWALTPSEFKDAVENAMKCLRRVLKGAELQEYEGYYERYKKASDAPIGYQNAYRILLRLLGRFGGLSSKDEVRAAGFVGGSVRLLSIHIDYIYDFGRRALIRRTRDSEAVIRDKLLSVEEAYKYVVEDVQGIARHISDRADKLPALTRAFLQALLEVEGATRYPEAVEQEKPREEKSGGEEVG
jgi:hypothetical protein